MRHWRVYIARDVYEAEPTTLEREAEARRYGVANLRDANLVVQANDERDARRVAGLAYHGMTQTVFRGPRQAVPVQIPA